MEKLIGLELKKNRMKPYITAVLIIAVCLLGMLYLLAIIPMLDPEEADLGMFSTYSSLVNITCVLAMASFSVLSAVMYGKIVIDEYAGKGVLLLFSYPISRKHIFHAKVIMVFLYTAGSMAVSCLLIFAIFFTGESIYPLGSEALSLQLILGSLLLVLIYSLAAAMLGCISLWFGYWKQSSSAAVVASIILIVLACQACGVSVHFGLSSGILLCVSTVLAVAAVRDLARKISSMEV